MDTRQAHHIYKYFEPADRFVRIRVADGGLERIAERWDEATAKDGGGMSAADYRRKLVGRYVEDFETDVEDLTHELYRLVIDVNPELDLRRVKISESPRVAPGPRRQDAAPSYHKRLKRLARGLEARVGDRIVGQRDALHAVERAVRRAALGWDRRGPRASLLLIGPTGTGKTELARTLADELGGAESLIRVDCTEFAEGHEYAKLIGAPPGYVGHDDGGLLSRGLERTPRAVVLFDEVEKAHPRLHDLLLQILDDGHVTDGRGQRLDLTQCFVVMTSNTGTRELADATDRMGFAETSMSADARDEIVRRALGERFRPEFLGRIDETVVFDALDLTNAVRIARTRLVDLAAQVRRSRCRVRFSSAVAGWVAREGLAKGEGARGIVHVIRREVEARLAELAIEASNAQWIEVSVRRGALRFARARA